MTHRSRLGVLVIDCQTDDLTEAVVFWTGVLGTEAKLTEGGKYADFDRGYPRVLLQAVEHAPRVHLDFETDDREAEADRLKALGAREVERIKGWIVMEAPTGHRFCLVKPQGDDFAQDTRSWGEPES